ncbi:MAG: hypothetical protein IJD19_01495 [Ruminococcus sp.]|nr:hypothetical protein [Ruminococcus sp.]
MADKFSVRVDNSFNLNSLVQFVAEKYRGKGYSADIQNSGNATSVKISKNTDVGYTLLGMVESVVVKLKVENGTLFVSFTETEYTSKIIAAILALFCAGALWITMIIGLVNQSDLNSSISKDIKAYLSGNVVKKASEIPVQNAFVQETPVQHTDVQEAPVQEETVQEIPDSDEIFAHDDTELDKTMGIF